jgi:integrase
MPRPRPTHLVREISRHGKPVWYCRRAGRRIRLHAPYGTPEFEAEFQAAIAGIPKPLARASEPKAGTLAWLIARYRETAVWQQNLSAATRRQRDNIFLHVIANAGDLPAGAITREKVIEGRDKRAVKTPNQARNFLDALRGLFRWALEAKHVRTDPTAGVKNPKRKKGAGFPPWSEADAEAYERQWPIGTKERVWFDVLCFTGFRRGDVVAVGRQHIRSIVDAKTGQETKVISLRTEKGQGEIEVTIPLLPILDCTLQTGPTADLAFICGENGRPLTKESFGNAFSEAARKAGVNKSAHGVRKIAATRAADNGATVHELMAIFGWKTIAMAEIYTREANRRRLALESAHKLVNDQRTSIVAPKRQVRPPERKG